ncbi:hypothetical protein K469DRAFT_399391 [Zopfia rhizophila CBS 207.26]|uniref:HTH CENPB-type domain-containing protein n=1 Tax=Zopfia rhizophila CBS 207.26 TaxID=1314779 RepID=A0A6A6DBX3_9PEZI|nr:hypothetical protein K469DRAFT_399391 [Zopfia rhizophila CBS 207.26]
MSPLELALDELKSLEPGEKFNFTATANKYGCDRSTLSKRFRGVQRSREEKHENQRHLNNQQEKSLLQYIDDLCKRGLPPTHHMLQNFAKEICRHPVGKHWPGRFLKRHNYSIFSK